MEPINSSYNEEKVRKAIAQALENFYSALIEKIDAINIKDILKSKNPYLYRAKSVQTAPELIESILQAFVSSSEETIFGNCFFEPIALAASGGVKSTTEGVDIDMDFPEKNVRYSIAVKSGTSVFNGDSKKRQEENFARAARTARTSGGDISIKAIVGYAYGIKNETGRGRAKIFEEVAGEEFWQVITGDADFYKKIISYMGTLPEKYIEQFKTSYSKAVNRLVRDFSTSFCRDDGSIDWERLVEFNSGSQKRKEREELLRNAKSLYDWMCAEPDISQNRLCVETKLGNTAARRAISYLEGEKIVIRGRGGKKTGWTILRDFPE